MEYMIYGPEPQNYGYWKWEDYTVINDAYTIDILAIL